MLNFLRGLAFWICSIIVVLLGLLPLCIVIFNRSWAIKTAYIGLTSMTYLAKFCCKIDWKLEGLENIPNQPFILACKHLSAWETLFFAHYFKIPVYVYKKELSYVPIFGWFMVATGMLAIDRSKRALVIEKMTEKAVDVIKNQKRILIIFPQGTRTPLGNTNLKKYPYKKGLANIASVLNDTPVVSATHNASEFFGKGFFSPKKPGTVTIKFMKPITKGNMENEEFTNYIQNSIEQETNKLF
jgi:1-acyl-sn-glycerol-3-phosphate acyltransferase